MKKQRGLFDYDLRLLELSEHGDPLENLNGLIDWNIFRPILTHALTKVNKGIGGRPPFDYVTMFKILILQRLYNLSDNQMEYQIKDRLSFMRFLDIGLNDNVPDEKTIWHFRECLIKSKTIKRLFKKFNSFLHDKGVIAKEGSIVDASFVHVPIQRNSREENKQIKQGKTPEKWEENPNKLRQKDVDAHWTIKNREKHYGYKNHVKIGKESKIIKSYAVSSANVHDSNCFEELIDKTDDCVWADSAYSGKKINQYLTENGIMSMINEKGYRYKKLNREQKELNRIKSKIRVRVEHVFSVTANVLKSKTIKTVGIKRAYAVIGLINLTYNMWRYKQLMK